MIIFEFSPPGLPSGGRQLAFARLGRFFKMLMLLDVCQNPCFFAELVKAAKGSFEGLIVPYFNSGQPVTPPLGRLKVHTYNLYLSVRSAKYLRMSMAKWWDLDLGVDRLQTSRPTALGAVQ